MNIRLLSNVGLCVVALTTLLTGCKEKPLFERLDSSDTGITFNNTITDTDTLNILNYQYIYNGGGVGVGDFNGDQKPDLFFAGNQVPSRLYVNEGDMHFKDVTQTAGVNGSGRWSSGVSVVDINADGRMDVYVSNTLHKAATRRANLLYVNQGNDADGTPRFREMAADYGIADTSYTTHAAFFDYDNDGDLDLYVLVDQIFDEKTTTNLRAQKSDGSSPNVDRLYRNDFDAKRGHAFFTDVSKQAGILREGFGLGVNICDINRDGWKDIYVTNDFATNDLVYINNHNGSFTNRTHELFKHTSYSAMGNDVADINNDGLADIVAMDMLPEDNLRKKSLMGGSNYFVYQEWDRLGYEHQYARNTLQINRGARPSGVRPSGGSSSDSLAGLPVFGEESMLAGMAETEWSWSPLLADFDHDGYRDLLITNGFPRDVTDRDFTNYYSSVNNLLSNAMRKELTAKMPQVKVSNYAFRNRGDATFENVTDRWGMSEPSFSNGAAYADLDGDGDLDYVVNNINDEAFVYRNTLSDKKPDRAHYLRIRFAGEGANPMGLGAIVEYELPGGKKEFYEHTPYRGFLSSVEPVAHLGLGDVRVIHNLKVTWPGGRTQVLANVNADQTITLKAADAQTPSANPSNGLAVNPLLMDMTDSLGLTYRHEETDIIDFNAQKTLLHKFTEYGPALAAGDVNGDGLVDMVVGGSSKYATELLLQQPTGRFVLKPLPTKLAEDAGLLLFDADGDGDLDLYAASGSAEFAPDQTDEALRHRLYTNDGRGNFTPVPNALPNFRVSGSCVKAADFDNDGDLDLFVGGRVEPYKYPMPVRSYILRNDGSTGADGNRQPHFSDVTTQLAPALAKGGLTCDALWTDYDNDGDADLMLASEWAPLMMLRNDKGRFSELENSGLSDKAGFWNSLTPGDFDNDGDVDYLAGNLGQNTLLRASSEHPVRMYAGDFDNNGFYDAFPSVYYKNAKGQYDEYPYFGWDDMVKQMIGIKKRYIKYAPFGQATMREILTEEERNGALKLSATYLMSSYIENKGNGQFAVRPLPLPAQVAPVFGMLAQDVDGDGNLDAVLVGNDYGSDLVAGRMDAFDGLVLKGDGKGGFRALPVSKSGFYVPGNAKALVSWPDARGRERLAVTQNRGPLRVFAVRQPQTFVPADARTTAVRVRLKDGRVRRQEIPFGTSFYSQSARGVWLLPGERIIKP